MARRSLSFSQLHACWLVLAVSSIPEVASFSCKHRWPTLAFEPTWEIYCQSSSNKAWAMTLTCSRCYYWSRSSTPAAAEMAAMKNCNKSAGSEGCAIFDTNGALCAPYQVDAVQHLLEKVRKDAQLQYCKVRREEVLPDGLPKTVAFPQFRSEFKTERSWRRAFRKRGFRVVNDPTVATFVISKSSSDWPLNAFAFGNETCADTQVMNQIPELSQWHNKLQLVNLLRKFEEQGSDPAFSVEELIPPSFLTQTDCQTWLQRVDLEPGALWVLKDGHSDNQKGVKFLNGREVKEIRTAADPVAECRSFGSGMLQRLLHPPMLLDGMYKCDFRAYILIASTDPFIAFINPIIFVTVGHKPYVLNTGTEDSEQEDAYIFTQHMGNHSKQMHLGQLGEQLGQSEAWVTSMYHQVKLLSSKLLTAIRSSCTPLPGRFSVLGVDFFVDGFNRVWLGEVNTSPNLEMHSDFSTWNQALRLKVVEEVVDMQLALLEARSTFAPLEEALLSKASGFEILVRENWSWHNHEQPLAQKFDVSRVEQYLEELAKLELDVKDEL